MRRCFASTRATTGTPINVTGHPRIDLLRPELRAFFDDGVRRLRERYGKFALLNTNFSKVNGFRYQLDGAEPASRAEGAGDAYGGRPFARLSPP